MMSPRWRKVLRDLWGNKTRTILVVLSIAVGVFAIGVILSTQTMLTEDLALRYAATNPADAVLYPNSFEADLVYSLRKVPEVQDAEARRAVRMRYQTDSGEWKIINVDVIADYNDMRLNTIAPVTGAWPPPEQGVLIERASLTVLGLNIGDTLVLETADGRTREVTIGGTYHDLNKLPVQFIGEPYACITLETLQWLGYDPVFDQLYLAVSGDDTDINHIRAVADAVETKLEKSGHVVNWIWIPEPGVHPANDYIQPLLIILGVLGFLSLIASVFLVVNIVNSLLAQHVQQIGIMKAIGARTYQIMQMYLALVLFFGLLSLLVALPLGAIGAHFLTGYTAYLLNFDLAGFRIPTQTVAIQIGVALVAPLLAAFYPVLKGARITVREAISEYGLGRGSYGTRRLDRIVEWLSGTLLPLSRPVRISLRNSVRRKGRLLLTLLTLTLGGAIFIAVLSVQASFLATLDDALSYFNYDVELSFTQPHRVTEIVREVAKIPGVTAAESWINTTARRVRPDGLEGPNVAVMGIPAETTFIQPTLLDGRWLVADDEAAIVLNTQLLREEPDVAVGEVIVLQMNGRESEWQVVGLVQGVMTGPIAYANQPFLARTLRQVGRSSSVQIVGASHDLEAQHALASQLNDALNSAGLRVNATQTIGDIRQSVTFQFNLVVTFLAIMALLIAVVGGLGLMGTMSINVLERTREIGVMRAIGASHGAIRRIVLVEGLFVGSVSWLFGSLLAYPIGKLLSDAVGVAFLESPLTYYFSLNGTLLWLGMVLLIAALASLLPAWNASRLSVRETLAYE